MKISWGYYSQYMESHKIHVPNHHQGHVVDPRLKQKKNICLFNIAMENHMFLIQGSWEAILPSYE
jgi:hypothetical protein